MKITIVAFEGCMASAVYGQADAFAIAAYISDRRRDASWSGREVRIATPDGKPVPGYGGHAIAPHCALAEAKDSDVILIPPIFNDIETTLAAEVGLLGWLRSFPKDQALLASTCTGAFFLAEAGILDGRRVTTNPAFSALFQQRYPAIMLALDERLIALAADIVIAADNARFAFHEIHFGVYPYGGALFRMIRAAGWNAAMRYTLTGGEFDAAEALRMNVVAQVCPLAESEATGMTLATANQQQGATRGPGSARAGADLGRPGRRGGAEPFGARHRSAAELTRRQGGDAGDRRRPSARVFRRATKRPWS
jgi:enoyl-CoA hydratase/isomerase-like protein/DJ-1/PfpI family protein